MEQWEVDWSRNHFNRMARGGIWAIPRSGLILRKADDQSLILHLIMPYTPELAAGFANGMDVPNSAEALLRHQRQDFSDIARRFEAAGIAITDPKGLLK